MSWNSSKAALSSCTRGLGSYSIRVLVRPSSLFADRALRDWPRAVRQISTQSTITVTAPEPNAATSTPAAAISRAVFNRGSSGSPIARASVSTAL